MTQIAPNSTIGQLNPQNFDQHSVATVFTQMPDTPHLLAVNYDARAVDVSSQQVGWRQLSFNHRRINNTVRTYSYVRTLGDQGQIAAPGSPRWMPQLLPPIYNFQAHNAQGHPILSTRENAGLTGQLTLLLSLAVFSAPRNNLTQVILHSVQPRAWLHHQFLYPTGRTCGNPSPLCLLMANWLRRTT